MVQEVLAQRRSYQWGGLAFALGNVLFLLNKVNEMSRLFVGHRMGDLISGQNPLLIFAGQILLIIGFVTYYRFYRWRVARAGKIALGFLSVGGIVLAIGHLSFMSSLADSLPSAILDYVEFTFLFVVFGLLALLIGLIWFGILALRKPLVSHWRWLPLATGLMGVIGFVFFSGEEITAPFLFFRTLFALGLVGLGLTLWLEEPVAPAAP